VRMRHVPGRIDTRRCDFCAAQIDYQREPLHGPSLRCRANRARVLSVIACPAGRSRFRSRQGSSAG
jgi:hypothetical protein